jgi:hypothetical protein
MKLQRLSFKNIFKTQAFISFRNTFNFRPIMMSIKDLKFSSVSDAFIWRTDNNFKTIFKFSDIFDIFFKIKKSYVKINFFSKTNQFIKSIEIKELNLSNQLSISSEFLNNIKDYGTFYIYHYTDEVISENTVISNRCYSGYSQNNNLYSFVHGNTMAKYEQLDNHSKKNTDIVKTSLIKNQIYRIQKYFDNFDKSELFFTNPTSNIIRFSINDTNYRLEKGCCKIIDISSLKIISIKSNCMFFRPIAFCYKNKYLDVHHC